MFKRWTFSLYLLLAWLSPFFAIANPVQSDHIELELIAEVDSIQLGRPFWVGLRLIPDEHWKTYWRNPGGTGLPTRIEWRLPEGTRAGKIHWPYPERFEIQGVTSYGYAGEVILLTQIRSAEAVHAGDILSLGASASWLVCYQECIPGSAELVLELPVKNAPPQLNTRWAPVFAAVRDRLPDEAHGWDASFVIEDNRLHLEVHARQVVSADAEEVAFFPYQQNLVSYAARQEANWTPSRLSLKQQTGDQLTTIPDTISGVIVVTRAAGQKSAYAVDFSLEEQPALSERGEWGRLPDSNELLYVIILAMAGGLLLNLMPCVFPVLSLKAIGLMEAAHISHQAQRLHGLAYTLGVMVFFCAVAGILYLLKAGGASIGWGFQLQTPWFVALLAYLLFILGLSFSGVLEFGSRFMGVGESLMYRGGYLGSFFTGALAAIVASPCTAPFMGTAIAFAIAQPPLYSLLVFLALGLGMALPFLLIAFVPRLGHILPKPGPWMGIFKQVMAFPLYLTTIWLLWVLGRQTSVTGMAIVLVGMVLLLFAIWLRHLRSQPKGRWRQVNMVLTVAATVSAFAILAMPVLEAPESAGAAAAKGDFWEPYSEARLAELRTQGRPVFVNMTADWCITCIVNERVALSLPRVRQSFKENNIVPLQGNWTNREPEITRFLEAFGRSGVPLYVLYPPGSDAEPVVLPQWLGPMTIMDALKAIENRLQANGQSRGDE